VSLAELSDTEKQIILQSMKAILRGRFLEGEFHTRLGIEPDELEQLLLAYPNVDDSDDDSTASLAINNCLNEGMSRHKLLGTRLVAMVRC
jgi:hypothetical protein